MKLNGIVRCLLPDNINCSGSDFRVAAHDGDAGSKGPINAEDDTLHSSRKDSQVAYGTTLISPDDHEGT